MLKQLALAVLCLFVSLSACEPNGSDSLEPAVPSDSSIGAIGSEEDDPTATPSETDPVILSALAAVNQLRLNGCVCGTESLPATQAIVWNTQLYDAALSHAKDMQARNYFSHTSPSGENVYHRLIASGYISKTSNILTYGENIAFGEFDLATAVQKWVDSPSHCANLMRDTYQEMAIAHEGNYWVQVFGAKRK